MLHEFISIHRRELISRCKEKAAKRYRPVGIASIADYGVPMFLQQLVNTLRLEATSGDAPNEPEVTPGSEAIDRAAALHGVEMLRLGYSIEQVVREYGDVCQAVAEVSIEQRALIATEEFRTLNRCLDNAIADAVGAFSGGRQISVDGRADLSNTRLGSFHDEQRRLLDISIQSFAAIQTGTIAMNGATAGVLSESLLELRALTAWSMSELHLTSAMTTLGAI